MDKETIITAQTALATLGFRLSLSGVLDDQTALAIKDFQGSVLLEPSGQLDRATMEAIKLLDNAWEGKDLPRENADDLKQV